MLEMHLGAMKAQRIARKSNESIAEYHEGGSASLCLRPAKFGGKLIRSSVNVRVKSAENFVIMNSKENFLKIVFFALLHAAGA